MRTVNAVTRNPTVARLFLYLGLLAAAPFLLYGCASGVMRLIGRVSEQRYPAPGRMVSVGTHSLQLYCTGSGTPTAVVEPGIGVDWTEWWPVSLPLTELTQVCLYDRAGYGWSQPGPKPRTALRIAGELHTLLLNAGVPGPYILIAHSFGGYVARVYAERFGKSLSGIVLVDPSNEDEPPVPVFLLSRILLALPPLSVVQARRFYLGQQAVPPELASLPAAFRRRFLIGSSMTQIETQRSEAASLPESREQARAAKIPGDLPFTVITAMHVLSPKHPDPRVPDVPPAVHREFHARLARQSARGEQILARNSGHMIPLDQPELIVGAVRDMILQSRRTQGTSR
jgi:pimeloyl-ACP methyl ester carboxylesterase